MLQKAVQNVFVQLSASLEQLTPNQYTQSCSNLFDSSIGQHVRHIIELFQCLTSSYETGKVSYEKRKRDAAIENNKELALLLLKEICSGLDKPNKEMVLESIYDENSESILLMETNFQREVAYNLDHAVHHMALIRVGINEVSGIELPETYGVADSTTKFKKACVQ